jgi:hypothetical protein
MDDQDGRTHIFSDLANVSGLVYWSSHGSDSLDSLDSLEKGAVEQGKEVYVKKV